MDAAALIGDIIAAALRDDQERHFNLWAQSVAAQTLADEVGPRVGHLADEAYYSLLKIPDNLLPMLDSPQGWSALARYIAGDLGGVNLDYFPTVH